ncbi:hypothetical protein [Kibdelosporangium persicum]|uniref:hypothetical protein n=1 Tax=Kibdelosporangium persicum TaxID=2698649 RepID=UPI001C26F95A|nr:hypothetical protein [Kibdelosporangium persicum]
MSLEELEATFERELLTDKRAAAETAYALACRHRTEYDGSGQHPFKVAKEWAVRAIKILDELPAEHIDQVTSTRMSVGGVDLPELLHSGVVRERLADLLQSDW